MKSSEKEILFWSEDPNILLNQTYIFEFFPTHMMSYKQQLNAITRSVIILTIGIMLVSPSYRVFIISLITMFMIYLMNYFKEKELVEGFDPEALAEETEYEYQDIEDERGEVEGEPIEEEPTQKNIASIDEPTNELIKEELSTVFAQPSTANPFNNVMVTDYHTNEEKKPAAPSYSKRTQENILESAKQLVAEVNPDQPDITEKLFSDLGEKINLEQSLRPFHSNPSTTIPNDQGAFANFCYGSMVSCKEDNKFACARNVSRYTNY
jgi:hypothetical protein